MSKSEESVPFLVFSVVGMCVMISLSGTSMYQLAILAVVAAGVVGVVFVVIRQIGVAPPAWIVNILWIILAVVVGCLAIKFLVSLL